ncbi:MAG: hypothetical protein LUB59_00020 [Candidatus Gastranaerophilales bacterium]|nr:hypothetical protein [Candidatus Gastranaerophilales bacterium]
MFRFYIILDEFDGEQHSMFGNLKYYDIIRTNIYVKSYSSIHGHPSYNGYSTPASFADFKMFNEEKSVNEVTAINPDDEYSSIKKIIKQLMINICVRWNLNCSIN